MAAFRSAAAADVDAVIELMRLYYAEDGYAFVESEARAAVVELLRDGRWGRLWVAEEGGRVVGYLAVTLGFSLEYRGRDAFLDELYIANDYRRQGLGRQALEIAEAACREMGIKALHLEVERHRERAAELYRQAGFEDHERFLMTKWL